MQILSRSLETGNFHTAHFPSERVSLSNQDWHTKGLSSDFYPLRWQERMCVESTFITAA